MLRNVRTGEDVVDDAVGMMDEVLEDFTVGLDHFRVVAWRRAEYVVLRQAIKFYTIGAAVFQLGCTVAFVPGGSHVLVYRLAYSIWK